MKKIYALLLLVFAISNYACGQSKTDKLDALISAYAKEGQFNGSVLVTEKGEIIYKKGFGLANMEWEIPNQPDTKFRLASVTKQFTAMLIVQLVSENKLKLDVPISTYLPDYPKKNGDIITIHQLLTHTSGIPNYTSFPGYRNMMSTTYRPEEIVRLFADSTLDFTPGERFQYSNSGYVLLGYIIEQLTGKSYEQVLQEKIFTPLKMMNSGYDHNETVIKNRAAGYNQVGNTFQNANYIDMSVPFSAGGIYSTVEDLYLWDQALYSEKLLPKKYLDLIFTKHIPAGQNYYGYGWQIGKMPVGNSEDQVETISHSGSINGFGTLITRIPSDKSLIVLLNNTGGTPLYDMTIAITGILYGKSYSPPKKSMAYSLLKAIEKEDINTALLFYKKNKDSGDYVLSENEMNLAGYQLLQSGKTKEAASVFKLNVEAYPNSFNTYDSYGEALLVLGDSTQAIENYKKSVKLNPGNENGVKILKALGVNTDTLIKNVAIEDLKLLEGEYLVTNPATDGDKYWKIEFEVVNGELFGNDRGYRYKLVPLGNNQFINPDDGESLVFDTKDKKAITLTLFGRFKFKKMTR
ncbi:MAG: serine hydrolase [Saprospiraceae bacterium]|uniref:Serine hydrolase n=1 Tax=Candidatus Opimibacter skivensis TaxID=2982028 RepID=A0A9D7XRR0_9BACT|nr:serine hydrolase [Candidatus Opimibacter skivensis]